MINTPYLGRTCIAVRVRAFIGVVVFVSCGEQVKIYGVEKLVAGVRSIVRPHLLVQIINYRYLFPFKLEALTQNMSPFLSSKITEPF